MRAQIDESDMEDTPTSAQEKGNYAQLRTSNRVRTLDLGDIVAHIECRNEGQLSWTS